MRGRAGRLRGKHLRMRLARRCAPVKQMLRLPLDTTQYNREPFQKLIADNRVSCSLSRSGNVWENAAVESFFLSLKTERIARKVYGTRDRARADVFDYIERF
jgi:putative transposase